ncbi:uncharacterized protein LOC125705001 [Brienomyrus brachyistius]|uniref:uncharacterized protein LOC125705001 n=1 Tax=Brienomyrus brachyistius TaxID=42636 RepID=UPI0020B1F1AB|nr:uncharacterized protein LOC125705001 [Brienomyrus brachyistius]
MKGESFRLLFIFIVIGCDGFLLHGSAGPLTARPGGAVLLPCFVDRPLPLEELEVDWRRTDSDTIVHLFQDGQTRPESQGDAYRGRVHFFSQEIPKGNFSLLLEGVRTADTGLYKCVVYTEQENHEARVEIQEVERLVVTGADEPVYAHAGEDVTLSCSVDTHVNVTELQVKWIKTDDDGDIMVLLYDDGENRPESQDGRYSGRAEFFTEEIPKGNFSMNLRKVRLEDKGEFRCEVHSDTDSASTTARIAALGYSSLHWLILGLCIAVTPVELLTGALSVRNLDSKNRQALLCHWSHVTVPPIMVSSAFILWGITEGSAGEAVTCAVISLMNILLLFIMAPYVDSTGKVGYTRFTILAIGSLINITAVCAGSLIEFAAKYSSSPAEKGAFSGILGEILFLLIFFIIFRILRFVLWMKEYPMKIINYITGITGIIFLIITVSSTIVVSVYLAKYYSDAAWKEQLGTILTMLMFPVLIVSFPAAFSVVWIVRSLKTTEKVELREILVIWGYFIYDPTLFNTLILAIYSHLYAWMQNTFILGYSISVAVAAFGLSSFKRIRDFLWHYKMFLEGFHSEPRKYAYFLGAFGLPLLNSVALAVALKFKADTGKQLLDLRLIVLNSGSVFLFGWIVIQMSAYWLARKEK